jgi:hypothetical protein
MNSNDQSSILAQRRALEDGQPVLPIVRACKIGDGILSHTEEQKEHFRQISNQYEHKIHFFVPASGSGSRMFAFLEEFLTTPSAETSEKVERFLSRLSEFALFRKLSPTSQAAYLSGSLEVENLITELLHSNGLHFQDFPKALIPFHVHEPFILSALHEQLCQHDNLFQGGTKHHFSIQEAYKNAFEEEIKVFSSLTARNYEVSFSYQQRETDAFVFDAALNVVKDKFEKPLRRPAGHGTLLQNIAALSAPYIMVKNIDNIQHFTKKQASQDTWKYLLGMQIEIRSVLKNFLQANDLPGFLKWNDHWQLVDKHWAKGFNNKDFAEVLNRPLRICGMVRNDGHPGGGPFIMNLDGVPTKQIVEKGQLMNQPNPGQLLLQSSYFNPVLMVLSPCDLNDKPHDLQQFADTGTFMIVEKNQAGSPVRFIEKPGLWNGGMAHWNTLFVEIANEVFSPVKTALDLLEFAHQANKGA